MRDERTPDSRSRVETVTFSSPLGSWELSQCAAPADLAPLVDCFWSVRGRVSYRRETILPTDRVELMFNLGLPHRVIGSPDGGGTDFIRAWVSGLQEGPLVVEPQYDTSRYDSHLVSVRLHPQGAYALLGVPMEEIANQVVEIDADLLPGIEELRERLFGAQTLDERFGLLARYVHRRFRAVAPALTSSVKVSWALERLRRSGGCVSIGELCERLDITRKHLTGMFHRQVGLAPKRLARIVKFSRVVEHLKHCADVRWAELAVDFGYYDQSHFNRDFRAFTGATPGEFLRHRSADGTSLVAGAISEPR
ncbi:MAG TPA: helix-turn-helix domain-containing protein [Vicinamibacteria bacterium]|nr:helix-turn-helix domain-containing protein [Vicinamibacteria bacterium]